MADTPKPAIKEYNDVAQEIVDEQAILDKYNAATAAQFAVQREQNRQNENAFYNQMYNTQKTAMDTIRQSNAAAVSTGASRGVQAANELSALLGLQQESVQSATELANANRQTAQEETAAMLENVLKAYQQAQQERSQLVTQGIEASAVEAEKASAAATADRANQDALQSALETNTEAYLMELANQGKDYTQYSTEGAASLAAATNNIIKDINGKEATGIFVGDDWKGNATGANKAEQVEASLNQIIKTYGLNPDDYKDDIKALTNWASKGYSWASGKAGVWEGKAGAANVANTMYNTLIAKMKADYATKGNTTK